MKERLLKGCFLVVFMLLNVVWVEAADKTDVNKADMDKGIIKYTAYDTTATSGTTWRTEGFTVKNEICSDGDPTRNPKGKFMLESGQKTSVVVGDKTITTFTFPEDVVRTQFDAAKVNSASLKKSGGYVYLNGIFRVYKKGKPASGYKDTLYEIMNAAPWRNPGDFKDRFNIAIEYEPVAEKQPVYLTIMKRKSKQFILVERVQVGEVNERGEFTTKEGNKIENGKIPMTMEWADENKTFYLFRTHWAKMSDTETAHKNGFYRKVNDKKITKINPKIDMGLYTAEVGNLQNRTFDVSYGGIEIVCIYRKYKKGATSTSTEIQYEIEEPYASGVIQADTRGNEQFDSTKGIPTTESQYVNVVTTEYLTQYRFRNYSGTRTYQKKIPGATNEDGTKQPDTYQPVTRSFSYWKIEDLNVYALAGADIENGSLPGKTIYLTAGGDYKAPVVSYNVYSNNMKEPQSGVEEIGMIEVRNDKLVFNGQTIMDGSWCTTSASKPGTIPESEEIGNNVLYQQGVQIEGGKANGEYPSIGTVIYNRICHYGSNSEGATAEYDIEDINPVIVHTPVVCDARVEDVRKYNQMLQPNQSVAGIVLDTSFKVELPTLGYHSQKKGYQYRDYAKYTAGREVKFPFDVYKEKTYYKAGTWITLYADSTEFYLPVWVDEGEYTVEFRARTINCDGNNGLKYEEEYANVEYENYVAVDYVDVEVSGRIYGLSLYDISDVSLWKSVFRKEESLKLSGLTFMVGDKNQNGVQDNLKKNTFVMVNGSHPEKVKAGVQKTGYVSRFHLTTIGNLYGEEDYINVKPEFYFIDETGERKEVDVYYTETFEGKRRMLVKVGGAIDATNLKSMSAGDVYTSIPLTELSEKARLEGKTPEEIKAASAKIYTFSNIMISEKLRTYIGQNYTPTKTIPSGVSKEKVVKSVQKWYFEYYLPSEIHICEKGFDVAEYAKYHYGLDLKEDFWLTEGYLLVNFEIQTITEEERRLSYINAENAKLGYCNMWKLEGFAYRKTDSANREYYFKDGDTLLYELDGSAAEDYLTGGTH